MMQKLSYYLRGAALLFVIYLGVQMLFGLQWQDVDRSDIVEAGLFALVFTLIQLGKYDRLKAAGVERPPLFVWSAYEQRLLASDLSLEEVIDGVKVLMPHTSHKVILQDNGAVITRGKMLDLDKAEISIRPVDGGYLVKPQVAFFSTDPIANVAFANDVVVLLGPDRRPELVDG